MRALVCPLCGAALRRRGAGLACSAGHRLPIRGGVLDLAGAGSHGSTAGVFDGPYGALYDFGVQRPRLAAVVGRALWGTDLRAMYRLMDRGASAPAGSLVLDVPVGGAPVLQRARRLRCAYIGADLSSRMLEHAAAVCERRGLGNVTLIRADATALPLRDASVDRILCFNGLHVIPDKEAVIAEFARVLRPGGDLLGSVLISPPSLGERLLRPWTGRSAWFFHPADPDALAAMARRAGFSRWTQRRAGGALLTISAQR